MTAPPRRLAAVVNGDVVGFSALTASNDERTQRLWLFFQEQITAIVHAFGGTIADIIGDNFLAEFHELAVGRGGR
jgi:class 3 adenylate cyclase